MVKKIFFLSLLFATAVVLCANSQTHFTFNLPAPYSEFSVDELSVRHLDFLFENNAAYFSSIFTNEISVQDIFGISKKIQNKSFPGLLFSKGKKLGYFNTLKNSIELDGKSYFIPKIGIPSKIAFSGETAYVFYYEEHALYKLQHKSFTLVEDRCAGFVLLENRLFTAVFSAPHLVIKDVLTGSRKRLWISNHTHFSLLSSSEEGHLYLSAVNEKDFNTYLFKVSLNGFILSAREIPEHLSMKVNSAGIIYYVTIEANHVRIEILK